jgi:hypothetical protein
MGTGLLPGLGVLQMLRSTEFNCFSGWLRTTKLCAAAATPVWVLHSSVHHRPTRQHASRAAVGPSSRLSIGGNISLSLGSERFLHSQPLTCLYGHALALGPSPAAADATSRARQQGPYEYKAHIAGCEHATVRALHCQGICSQLAPLLAGASSHAMLPF